MSSGEEASDHTTVTVNFRVLSGPVVARRSDMSGSEAPTRPTNPFDEGRSARRVEPDHSKVGPAPHTPPNR